MKKTLKIVALTMCGAMAFTFASCAKSPANGSTINPKKIGIIQMMKHDALDSAREGFIAALAEKGLKDGEAIIIDYKDGNGDNNNMATIADQFVADKKDLVLAIATPAAIAIAGKTTEIPILATAVTDFEYAGLVDDHNAPGGNLSGTSDLNPIKEQLDLLIALKPDVKTIGFLYNSSEDNSRIQIEIAKEYLNEKGISFTENTVSNQNDVQQATQDIVSRCDALYLPTDNVFASSMPIVQEITVAAKMPVVCGENGMVTSGGLASIGITYYDLGYQAGLMAVDILTKDADISKMPVGFASDFEYCINEDVANAIGITIPDELKQYLQKPSDK